MKKINVRHFTQEPNIKVNRSAFDLSHYHLDTCNAGDLIPITCKEVLPGDTFKCGVSSHIRMQTLLTPIFGRIFCDIDWFFVPNRIVWQHWEDFMGDNKQAPWKPVTTYTVPTVEAPATTGWVKGTIAEKIGMPIGKPGLKCSALPLRAFAMIYRDWYRSEALQTPSNVPVDDVNIVGSNGTDYVTDLVKGGMCPKVTKSPDLFTSLLPEPQRGDPVNLPLGDNAPILIKDTNYGTLGNFTRSTLVSNYVDKNALIYADHNGDLSIGAYNDSVSPSVLNGVVSGNNVYVPLGVDLSDATATSVNELRMAFQLQKYLERSARSGGRYFEYISAAFGVVSPDSRLQRPEYLGGEHFNINVNAIYQNSETGSTPQGNVTGVSSTRYYKKDFVKSFDEHGWIFGLATIRYMHSYDQGIPKQFSRLNKLDFYDPIFANLGEQAVFSKEIYADGTINDDIVLGYNEAWVHYRFSNNEVCGELRTQYSQSLDSWHLGDKYSSRPTLSASWIQEDHTNIDRVLSVASSNSNQFLCDFWVDMVAYRPLPTYSIPGLIDHH